MLINLGNEEVVINNNDRIAQMVIASVDKATWIPVQQLNETNRGVGGFGHTGIQ